MNNIETLRAAVYGHVMEHGIEPTFVLMSSDVAVAIFRELEANPTKYGGLINKGGGPFVPMTINLGTGPIEIAQCTGQGRVELVVDATIYKVRRTH